MLLLSLAIEKVEDVLDHFLCADIVVQLQNSLFNLIELPLLRLLQTYDWQIRCC